MEGGRDGWRCIQRSALPHHRAIARRPRRCFIMSIGSVEFSCWPNAWPIERIVAMASGHQPPSVSTTMGRKSTPAARQDGRLDVSFLRMPTLRAWPGEAAASNRVSCCSGDIILTSSAAGCPRHQCGCQLDECWNRAPNWGLLLWEPEQQTGQHWTAHPESHYGGLYDLHCPHSPPDDPQRGQLIFDILGRCRSCCEVRLPASNADSNETPGRWDGVPSGLKVRHSASLQHGATQSRELELENVCWGRMKGGDGVLPHL